MTVKKKIYLTVIIFSFLIVLMIAFIILPFFYRIRENSWELSLQKEKLIEMETKTANLNKFKVLYADLEHFLREVDNLFVEADVPIEFISFLENTSEKCQLETEILSVSGKKSEKDFWPHLTFQVISVGSFSDFLKFLEKIENSSYLVEVQSLTINRATQEKELALGKKVKAAFSINVFVK